MRPIKTGRIAGQTATKIWNQPQSGESMQPTRKPWENRSNIVKPQREERG
jgi:hypothetical protein